MRRARGAAPSLIVIGGGFGGLAAAIRLQAAGYQVTLVEARERLGGRAYQLKQDGFTFDMGPTLITAPELIEQLWQVAGRRMQDDLEIVPLSPFYRIYFEDGRHFDYWGTAEADEAEIARFDQADVVGYRAFLRHTQAIYERAFADLAARPFVNLPSFLRVLPELVRSGAASSVYRLAARYFRHPYMRMVFSFHPLFIGGNPFRASAIYSIIPYLERLQGVHFAMGGMYSLVRALERLFHDLGGIVRCNSPVEQILVENGRTAGVRLAGGEQLRAAAVVANSDVTTMLLKLLPAAYRGRISTARLRRAHYSMSCFLLYLGVRKQYSQLKHHTVFMPDHYRRLIAEIFDGRGMPQDLAVYLHAPTKTDPSLAPPGCESLYVLAPVPNLGHGIDWQREGPVLRQRIVRMLEEQLGLEGLEQHIVVEHRFTPLDFESQLGSWMGAAFSLEPTLTQSAYFRVHNRYGALPGLYFVGAGTHPGAGIPGVLLSAAVTTSLVMEDLPLAAAARIADASPA
ncbi:MAG: phytoene desaturase [Herpetosiphonaceae bacterium]|nr:MAG: phytoene desaturase [Herpetosiphonaceae bacterium]